MRMSRSPESRRLRPVHAALAAVLLGATVLSACAASGKGTTAPSTVVVTRTESRASSSSPTSSASSSAKSSVPAKPARVVRVTALQNDGQTYGVGMPIVLYFRPAPTSAAAFEKAAQVTVNGKPAGGAWFWEQPTADEKKSGTIEAHYRQQLPWPADSQVHVALPIGGVSAGTGKVYGKALTSLAFSIGDKHVSTARRGRTRRTE